MFSFKKNKKKLSLILSVLLLLSACGVSSEEDLLNETNGEADIEKQVEQSENIPIGRFIQTDITPEGIGNVTPITFSQGADSRYLLSVYDEDKKEPRSFASADGNWTEYDNTAIIELLHEKDLSDKQQTGAMTFIDFTGNWWTFYVEDGLAKGYQLLSDGTVKEIEINTIEMVNYLNHFQISENGTILFGVHSEDSYSQQLPVGDYIFMDTETGEMLEDNISNRITNLIMEGEILFARDFYSESINFYDITTGEVSNYVNISEEVIGTSEYTIDSDGELTFLDSAGIYKIEAGGSLVQTVIEDTGFAYADPNLARIDLLVDRATGDFIAECQFYEGYKIFQYSFDETLPTNKSETLFVWAFEDNHAIRAAATVFAQENPDCEVRLEFGKTADETDIINEDIIRNMNTKILAGEVPDVLFLDGLSIDSFYEKGILSNINIELEESKYHETILNSYTDNGVAYAYPIFFRVPIFLSSDTSKDIKQENTLENIEKLYQDTNLISNNWYQDIFVSFYYAFHDELFPDNQSINEEALTEFLTLTEKMVDSQNMVAEPPYSLGGSSGARSINIAPTPSFDGYTSGETTKATGILKGVGDSHLIIGKNDTIEIEPLLGGNYINQLIASIPEDAKNKEMAEKYIAILLTNDSIQLSNTYMGFPVKKDIELEKMKEYESKESEESRQEEYDFWLSENYTNMEGIYEFDWDEFISKLTNPCEENAIIYDIIYEQAEQVYGSERPVEAAVSEIMKQLTIYFAEKS